MHVAFLTPEYPHVKINHSAGLGTSINNLALALVAKNITVTIFVYSQNKTEFFEDSGIKIYKIAHKKYKFLGWYLHRKHIQNYVNKVIEKQHIQLLEAADWTGITAFMKIKCKLLIRLHGSDGYFCHLENRKQKKKNYFFEKLAFKNADNIVSVSRFTANKTNEIFNLNREIPVVFNGVDIEKFTIENSTINTNTLLYFGSIIRKKGILELAHIFNKIIEQNPSVKLTLLGNDVIDVFNKKSTLELFFSMLSDKAKLNVEHIAHVDYKRVNSYIAQANVVVLPSLAEALPMTWLEAMAMKKAIVTSNIGWAKEMMVNGETGFTVSPKNHREYANRILQLLENKELAKSLGENARKKIVKQFRQEIIVNDNIKYYRTIV